MKAGSKKLKVGLAGYGVVGIRRHPIIDEHPNMRVVAIADQKFADPKVENGVKYFRESSQLLNEDLDILFVCLPNDIAPDVTIAGLKKGLHVFCEKPPGRTVEDIVRVREVEKSNPTLKLKYGFNHRYHHSVLEALRIVRSGEFGPVLNMRGVYGKSAFIPWPRPSAPSLQYSGTKYWRTSREIAGGGILLDQGIHMVDLMRAFAGDFDEIKSFITNSYWKHDVEDNAYALMKTKEGVVAFLHSTATQWRHRFSLEITLEKGALILSGILSGSKSYGEERLTVVYRDEADNGIPREQRMSYIRDDSWRDEIFEFGDSIVADKPILIGSSEDALKTMSLVYSIYHADPDWKKFLGK